MWAEPTGADPGLVGLRDTLRFPRKCDTETSTSPHFRVLPLAQQLVLLLPFIEQTKERTGDA